MSEQLRGVAAVEIGTERSATTRKFLSLPKRKTNAIVGLPLIDSTPRFARKRTEKSGVQDLSFNTKHKELVEVKRKIFLFHLLNEERERSLANANSAIEYKQKADEKRSFQLSQFQEFIKFRKEAEIYKINLLELEISRKEEQVGELTRALGATEMGRILKECELRNLNKEIEDKRLCKEFVEKVLDGNVKYDSFKELLTPNEFRRPKVESYVIPNSFVNLTSTNFITEPLLRPPSAVVKERLFCSQNAFEKGLANLTESMFEELTEAHNLEMAEIEESKFNSSIVETAREPLNNITKAHQKAVALECKLKAELSMKRTLLKKMTVPKNEKKENNRSQNQLSKTKETPNVTIIDLLHKVQSILSNAGVAFSKDETMLQLLFKLQELFAENKRYPEVRFGSKRLKLLSSEMKLMAYLFPNHKDQEPEKACSKNACIDGSLTSTSKYRKMVLKRAVNTRSFAARDGKAEVSKLSSERDSILLFE